jgi:hypothetical protein
MEALPLELHFEHRGIQAGNIAAVLQSGSEHPCCAFDFMLGSLRRWDESRRQVCRAAAARH